MSAPLFLVGSGGVECKQARIKSKTHSPPRGVFHLKIIMELYRTTATEILGKESTMSRPKPSYGEALAALARMGHFSDKPQTHALAQLLTQGVITIERIKSLDIQ